MQGCDLTYTVLRSFQNKVLSFAVLLMMLLDSPISFTSLVVFLDVAFPLLMVLLGFFVEPLLLWRGGGRIRLGDRSPAST